MPALYPYTVTNSYKGGFYMRTYGRNVRRAWDGDDYRAPKRQRLENSFNPYVHGSANGALNENASHLYDSEDTLERAIRETSVAALSSSPSRKNSAVFTDFHTDNGAGSTITPPSSPPPELHITPPNVKARKPTFSFMEKKKQKERERLKQLKQKSQGAQTHASSVTSRDRDESEPLEEIHNSSSRALSQSAQASLKAVQEPPKLVQQKSLTQSVLDFGQSLQPITCAQCHMSYTPSVADDVQLHMMYHNRHNQGIELGKPFLKSAMKWCYEVPHIPGSAVVVDRKISLPGRRVVQRVLEVVNKELGSVDISEADLWSQKVLDGDETDEAAKKVDRYKVFLHVIEGKCVGVCLAERIDKAYQVRAATDETQTANGTAKDQKEPHDEDASNSMPTPTSSSSADPIGPEPEKSSSSADLALASEATPAIVGVSRIWTSQAFRRKGIAQNLLECVVNQFIYGLEIEKNQIAFSQPTEMGVKLARDWHGEEHGWTVYLES